MILSSSFCIVTHVLKRALPLTFIAKAMILLNDLRFIMQIGIVDPDCRIIGLHLYDGLFKVSPLSVTSVLMDLNHLSLVPSCTFAPQRFCMF
jgi:hypothetical protein